MKFIKYIFILLSFSAIAQQDHINGLYMFNPMGINPAYAGSRDAVSTVLIHRSQWVGLNGAPTTQVFSINAPVGDKSMGLGGQITNDAIGPKSIITITGAYAYKVKLGKGKLAFGLQAGVLRYNYDWNAIDYRDEQDALPKNAATNFTLPTFDFGLYFNTNTFYAGMSFNHMNQAKFQFNDSIVNQNNFGRIYPHSTLTIGKAFVLSDKITFKPSTIIKATNVAGYMDLNLSVLFNNVFWAGVSLTSRNSLVPMIEINPNRRLRIGYAFEYSTNVLSQTIGRNTHEIFLGYDFGGNKSKVLSPRYF
ncbi:MAG: type IX secretion system membrane protein PorP/SprF [Vicingaceae bacterium]